MRMNSLLLNAGMNGVAQGVSKLIRFAITSIALVRYGAASWGEIAFALTVLTYLNFVLDFGLSSLALIERPDDKGLDRKFYIALSYVRGFLILAMFALAAGATCLFDISSGFILKAYLLQLFLKPFNFDWFLSRKGYTAYSPLVQTVRQVLLLGVLVAVSMPSIENFVMLDVGTEILATFVLWVIGPKKEFRFGPPSRQELRGAMSCYRGSLILFVSSSLLLFHQNFDIFVLKYFVGNAAVGIYDYCFRYVMFIFVLGSSLSIPLRRQLARLKEANATDARSELVFCSHKVLGLLSAAFLFGTMCFSEKFFSVVVPVDKIPDFLIYIRQLGEENGIRIRNFGHAGDGNLHIYCCSNDLEEEEFKKKVKVIMDAAYTKCAELEGQVSGEHSIGHAKMVYLEESVGEDVFKLMGEIKKVFDPDYILNPGKVCDSSLVS